MPEQVRAPEFALSGLAPSQVPGVSVLAYPVLPDGAPVPGGRVLITPECDELGAAAGLDLLDLLAVRGATGAAGEVVTFPRTADGAVQLVLLVGVGEQRAEDLRRAGAALARATQDCELAATSLAAGLPEGGLGAFVEGVILGSFGFHWRSGGPVRQPVGTVVLTGVPDDGADGTATTELARAVALGGAGWHSRALATVPSNVKDPAWLAEQAREIAGSADLGLSVWDEAELARRGMGGLLAVGAASASPPRLIRLEYAPRRTGRRTPTVVLVGKGITFDTGGLSIKPAESMTTMKRDMTGGGVVLAVMAALRDVGCPLRVTGLVAAAENAIGGAAMRPGDVIRHYGGRTSEVTNTDAEGRLVLADALAYAVDELNPAAIVDVATLTGAMKVALGQRIGGFFANDEGLAAAIGAASLTAGEPLWRFPLHPDYEGLLSSKVADADNAAGGPGAITAALFLQHFVGKTPWVHLDIASVGDSPNDRYEWTEGPTGFGARLLLRWLGQPDPLHDVGKAAAR